MTKKIGLLHHKDAKLTLSFFLFSIVIFGVFLWSAFAVVPLEFPANNTNASAIYGLGPNGNSPSMAFFNSTNGLFKCNVSVVNGSTVANITRVVLFINQTTSQLDNNSATINLTHTINSTFVSSTINFTVLTAFNDGQFAWMCQQEDNNSLKIINQSGTNFFTIDTTAPTLVAGTLSNNSATGSSYRTGQTAVLGANVTDLLTSIRAVRLFVNVSGLTSNEVNITRNVANNTAANLSYFISFASSQVLNFTFEANDTLNNRKNLSTSLIFNVLNTIPDANTTFNASSPSIGTVFNFTGNVTDDVALHTAQWITNVSGTYEFFNHTLSGASAQVSNLTTFTRGGVFNFTLRVNDTVNNIRNNISIITVADNVAPIVNTTFNISISLINNGHVLNFTANITDETALASVTITNNMSGTTVTSTQTLSGTSTKVSNLTPISASAGAVVNFSMTVTDAAGNSRQNSTVFAIVDTTAPTITVSTPPQAVTTFGVNNLTPTLTVSSDASTCLYEVNRSGTNISMTLSSTTCIGTATIFKNGNHNLTFFVNDTSGNAARLVFFLNVSDGTAPTAPNGTYSSVGSISTTSATVSISGINETFNATVYYGTSQSSQASQGGQETDFSSSQSVSLSGLTANTTYFINVTVCDYTGNCAFSNNISSFTTSAASSGSGGGGSGGGSSSSGSGVPVVTTNTQASTSKVWSEILADTPVTMYINNEKIAISAITLNSGETLSSAEIGINSLKAKPTTISSEPATSVYQYFDITSKNMGTKLQNVVIEFDVLTSWLTTNGIDRDTVVLYRFANSQWSALPTSVANIKTGEIEYTATTPGFSTFAIGSPASSLTPPESTPSTDTTTTEQPATPSETTEGQPEALEPYAGEEPSSIAITKKIMPYIAVGLVIVLLIIVVVINQRKKRKEKGKDEKEFSF